MADGPLLTRVTPADLQRMREDFARAFPDADETFRTYALSAEVVLVLMGPEWWRRHLASDSSHDFFVRSPDDPAVGFWHQHRVHQLHRDLLVCQHLDGFDQALDDIRTRDVPGAMNELWVASQIAQAGRHVAFVERSGVKGEDFDILVDDSLPVEAKAKADATAYSESTLQRTLREARQQLPATGPGVVFVRVPRTWVASTEFHAGSHDVIGGALRNSGRINAVVVSWEQAASVEPQGMAFFQMYRAYENHSPKSAADIGELMRSAFQFGGEAAGS